MPRDLPGQKQIERLNSEFFAVLEGGKFWVVEEKLVTDAEDGYPPSTVMQHVFGQADSFTKFWNYEKVAIPAFDRQGKEKSIPDTVGLGTYWMNNHLRRTYRRIVFNPMRPCKENEYNLFHKYRFDPDSSGCCDLYNEHVLKIVCSGNVGHYNYLRCWMAMAVQRPWVQAKVTVVLKGGQGTGKGSTIEPFGRIFGEHYFYANDPEQIIGKYNYHLAKTILLFGDEAIWAGSTKDESKLKSLITEPRFVAEDKYKPCFQVENRLHIMMATNNDWAAPVAEDDRRFFILNLDESVKQNTDYFNALSDQMKRGGCARLLFELQQIDLSKFEILKVPKTDGLLFQKIQTFRSDPAKEWYYTKLWDGYFFAGRGWNVGIPTAALLKDHDNHARRYGASKYHLHTPTSFGCWLRKMNGGVAVNKDEEGMDDFFIENKYCDSTKAKVPHYYFDKLETCRERFSKFVGQPINWPTIINPAANANMDLNGTIHEKII